MSAIVVKERTAKKQAQLGDALHPVLQKIYANRGVLKTSELEYSLKQLHPDNTLHGLDLAVGRLADAIENQEHIMIIGDFDADGATSSALAVSALKAFGALHVNFIVPNRFEYGYGLTPEIVDLAYEQKPNVIITVDNGISSIDGVARANALGIDVVITDHHLPGDALPDAVAIVNPNLPQCPFPSGALAGVGVIFYVMCGLRRACRARGWFAKQGLVEPNMAQFLDLVALGTVADVVKLDHNNRILVHQGLERMRAGLARPGIKALLAVSGRDATQLTATDLGFSLGPRLNAAGRLTDMSIGILMLLSEDFGKALSMARMLDDLNKERRRIESEMHVQALQALDQFHPERQLNIKKLYGYCFYQPDWHQGVIGILAGRLKERLHRPVIAFAQADDTMLKGSARSIPGIHIRDVLDSIAKQYPKMLTKFGGHAMAAGLGLAKADFAQFSQAFDAAVKANCSEEDLQQVIYTDGELVADDISLQFAMTLQAAGPWGQGYPEPSFYGKFAILSQRLVGEKHLKMTLRLPGAQHDYDAIAFNVDTTVWPNYRATEVECVYRLDVNTFNYTQRLQLVVEYLVG